jgi:hypothetical protein
VKPRRYNYRPFPVWLPTVHEFDDV